MTRSIPTSEESGYEIAPKVGSLYQIAADVAGLRLGMVNVFFLGEPDSPNWVLVDAGLRGSAQRIIDAAEERFGLAATPSGIILTHGHFDHVGALRALLQSWNAPVYAHRMEIPYLNGRASYPPADPGVGGGPPMYFTPDWDAARDSVQYLVSMNPSIIGTGHELPLHGGRMIEDLRDLAENFDRAARPKRGRYVARPAVMNLSGVVSLPPRLPWHPITKMVIAGLLAAFLALAAGLLWRGDDMERNLESS